MFITFQDCFAKYLPLGIGLCYLGKQDAAEATIAALEVMTHIMLAYI